MKRAIRVFRASKRKKLLNKLLSPVEKPGEGHTVGKEVVLAPVMQLEGRPL